MAGICAYTYHVPLSLWFSSGVEHGSLSYICKILFNTWYIFHTSVIDSGPKHKYTGAYTQMLNLGMILIFSGIHSHYGVSVPSIYFLIIVKVLISYHYKSVIYHQFDSIPWSLVPNWYINKELAKQKNQAQWGKMESQWQIYKVFVYKKFKIVCKSKQQWDQESAAMLTTLWSFTSLLT